MTPTIAFLATAVADEASHELGAALKRIDHCLSQLSDEQVWSRPRPEMNSIGNLILHLCGNVRQWIIAGIGGAPDDRRRPAEFAERGPIPRAQLQERLQATVREAQAALSALTPADLLAPRRIQGFDMTALRAIFDSV